MPPERLQKILAAAGIASRRGSEEYIREGRVKVNGVVVRELGAKADAKSDEIEVEGHGVLQREPLVYIALHKPAHVISSVRDPEGRKTVIEMLEMTRAYGSRQHEGALPRLYPVGRLDFDAEGLILLTNDGELANRLMHPRHHVPKTYLVKVKGRPDPKAIERLRAGVRLPSKDGRLGAGPRAKPAEIRTFKESPANTWVEMTITEGRNHQVKRMCQAVNLMLIRLVRTEFGGIEIADLPGGAWRFLSKDEVQTLKRW